jgi:quercetin dioxygenase-like cupin family protein
LSPDDARPVFVQPHEGTELDFLAVTHRLTSPQTGGAYYLFGSTFDPGTSGRLHIHRREIEIGYVLEGALEIRLGDRTQVLEAGGVAHLPMNIAHGIRNPLETRSRYLFIVVPGGLDRFFDAVAQAKSDGVLNDATHGRLSVDYGIEWLE